jgi:hypothetical protein
MQGFRSLTGHALLAVAIAGAPSYGIAQGMPPFGGASGPSFTPSPTPSPTPMPAPMPLTPRPSPSLAPVPLSLPPIQPVASPAPVPSSGPARSMSRTQLAELHVLCLGLPGLTQLDACRRAAARPATGETVEVPPEEIAEARAICALAANAARLPLCIMAAQ